MTVVSLPFAAMELELSQLFDLPAHPLLVHIPVVLLPLVALGTIAIVLRPAFRRSIGWVVVALGAVAAVGTQLAIGSGEELEDHVRKTELVRDHTGMADTMLPFALLLFVLALAVVLIGRRQLPEARKWIMPVIGVLAVAISLVTTVRVIQVGHSGAKASWHETDMDQRYRGDAADPGEDGDQGALP